jgi:hypothetical protein
MDLKEMSAGEKKLDRREQRVYSKQNLVPYCGTH